MIRKQTHTLSRYFFTSQMEFFIKEFESLCDMYPRMLASVDEFDLGQPWSIAILPQKSGGGLPEPKFIIFTKPAKHSFSTLTPILNEAFAPPRPDPQTMIHFNLFVFHNFFNFSPGRCFSSERSCRSPKSKWRSTSVTPLCAVLRNWGGLLLPGLLPMLKWRNLMRCADFYSTVFFVCGKSSLLNRSSSRS